MTFENKEIDFDCLEHGNSKVKVFCVSNTWSAAFCKDCAEIKKQEAIKLEQERLEKEKERERLAKIQSLLLRAGIPPRFKNHSFETFIAKTADQELKKKVCLDYVNNFEENFKLGKSMILCGTTGTGKTHIACSIANQVIQNRRSAIFINVFKVIDDIKETWSKQSDKTEREVINDFIKTDLLILDEIGVQFGSDSEKMILFKILNERYSNMKPTILISNLNSEALEEFVGERVKDRMRENGGMVVNFNWQSYRGN
jgi:DNA replication protein DnaC